jgi:hypothetical protein
MAWSRQLGGARYDYAGDVAVYGSSVYVAGAVTNNATGNLNAYLTKYSASGPELWAGVFDTTTAATDSISLPRS